jgi:hypothetical protein
MKQIIWFLMVIGSFSAFAQGIPEMIELVNVADGQNVVIKPCGGCHGVVVIFTSLSCPYDQLYHDRIKALIDKYAGNVSFFLVNSNPGTEEQDSKMKEAYAKWGLSIPYLSDKKQLAMTVLNAKKTPEAVLLKPEGKTLKIVYQGAIDDNPQVHHDTGHDFLDQAITELVSGKPINVPTERVIGCTLRKAQ